ncbi:hypothetical protein MVES_002822 [Malassezia vespertilionis]|uniref:Nuclear pore complex protein Nup85 n=1 Tax=Malassezia vespertilionis TaxID=2020962 RepID=A0A2N1J9L6_9BASI|nr:hypothetical protein MVES_002822 [Malassezia vespertilionis]
MSSAMTDAEDASARTKTSTIFNSLQSIAASQQCGDAVDDGLLETGPSVQTMQYFSRIAVFYCDAIHTYFAALEAEDASETQYLGHVQALHTIFKLTQVLYFPEDGRGLGVIGEELLHWLNAHDVAPTTEQGQEIAKTSPSHEHPEYWDYLFRCVLRGFYTTAATVLQSYISTSESPTLRSIATFATEQAFFSAHRNWHTSVRVFLTRLLCKMDAVQEELAQAPHATANPENIRLELEAQFRCLLELLIGVRDRILEFSEDWREAVCAWGTLVQPALKRDDLPDVVQLVTEKFPVDGTLPSEMVLVAVMRGDMSKVIKLCTSFDEWLATHVGDLCNKAQLFENGPAGEEGAPLMDKVLFTWADTLLQEERLWRMALEYIAVIGTPVARTKMREVVFSVPLLEGSSDPDAQFRRVEEVLGACIEYGMDDEVRIVCQRVAQGLLERKQYGVAIAYSVRARDAQLVRTIANSMLHDYVEHGPEHFIRSVDTIPRVLLDGAESLAKEAGFGKQDAHFGTSSIFSAETFAPLVFHVKYRDFHELYLKQETWLAAAQVLVGLMTSDVTPESFLSVLLVDALPLLQASELYFSSTESYELLRIVEKIGALDTSAEASDYYFYWLEQLLQHSDANTDTKQSASARRTLAQERMQVVRLAIAQYLSRVLVENRI